MSRTNAFVSPRALGAAAATLALSLAAPAAWAAIPGTGLDPTAWLRADAVNGVDAEGNANPVPTLPTAIATWDDATGHGPSATQTAALQQPTFVPSALNGKPVVRFDGSSTSGEGDFMNIAGGPWARTSADKLTMFVIAKDTRTSGTDPRALISTRGGSTGWVLTYEPNSLTQKYVHIGTFTGGNATNTTKSDTLGTTNDFHLLQLRRDGLAVELGHDGVWQSAVNFIGQNTSSLAVTQIGNNDNSLTRFFKGDVAEIIAFNGVVLTDAQSKQVESYLTQKYALGAAVPEPTGLGLLAAAVAAPLLGRRRRAASGR
jgi:hypothetical protein